ncbi:MAG: rubredoxin [Methanoregula sp.]|nr:rubredoxin [Methanoregula sp.]
MAKAATTSKKVGGKMTKKPVAAKKKAVTKKPATPGKKSAAAKKEGVTLMRYKCRVCGYVYSPLRGEPHNGIPTGTAFEDLPDTYLCPVCGFQGKGKVGKWGFDEWRPTRYICSMCDYIYDEKRGEPHRGIKPGTKFEDLPEDYVCPVCATDPKIVLRYGNVLKQGFSPLYE